MAHVDPPEGSTFALQGFLGSSTGADQVWRTEVLRGASGGLRITVWGYAQPGC